MLNKIAIVGSATNILGYLANQISMFTGENKDFDKLNRIREIAEIFFRIDGTKAAYRLYVELDDIKISIVPFYEDIV